MVHSIPEKSFELDYSAPMDWEWHECPYPKPTAKLYGAGHDSQATEKTVWRHRWTDFPRAFETEIREFIEGKNLRMTRKLISPVELKFSVAVLEGAGEDSKVIVGPVLCGFRKDGAVVGTVKLAADKGVGFYLKIAEGMLNGSPVSGGDWRRSLPQVELQARGNAINNAGGVAASLLSKGGGVIGKVSTCQRALGPDGRQNVPEISIRIIRKGVGILPLVAISPYSVLGSRMAIDGAFSNVAPEPGADTVFVDPAGLPYIQNGPSGAGGAAGVIYGFLGIKSDPAFPDDVKSAITKTCDAKFHAYGEKKCIHAVGPDFRIRDYSRDEAVAELAKAYQGILTEFVASGLANLRLLPVSGGIFSGPFSSELPGMTAEALQSGFLALTAEQQEQVKVADRLEMCIFMEKELKDFTLAFGQHRSQ